MWGFVGEWEQQVLLRMFPWLPSHRAHVVSWSSSFLVLGVAFYTLAGVGLFCLLGDCFVLGVLVYEGLVA